MASIDAVGASSPNRELSFPFLYPCRKSFPMLSLSLLIIILFVVVLYTVYFDPKLILLLRIDHLLFYHRFTLSAGTRYIV